MGKIRTRFPIYGTLLAAVLLIATRVLSERVWGLFWQSLSLASIVLAIVVLIAVPTAFLLAASDSKWRPLQLLFVLLALAWPPYLLAVGWDSGIGRTGWMRLLLGSDSLPRFSGWLAVVTLHVVYALPYAICILGIGWRRMGREFSDQLQMIPTSMAMRARLVIELLGPYLFVTAMLVASQVVTEMTFTDLYAVRSYAEEIYLGYATQFQGMMLPLESQTLSKWEEFGVLVAHGCCILVLPTLLSAWFDRIRVQDWSNSGTQPPQFRLGFLNVPFSVFNLITLFLLVAIPFSNQIVRVGIYVQQVNGRYVRSWSLSHAWQTVVEATYRFRQEFVWTALIASIVVVFTLPVLVVTASQLRMRMALGTIRQLQQSDGLQVRERPSSRVLTRLAVFGLLFWFFLPAPSIGIAITKFFMLLPQSISEPLFQRSILPPVLAIVLRYFPLFFFLSFLLASRTPTQLWEQGSILRWGKFKFALNLVWRPNFRIWLALAGILWLFGFGELAASNGVLPAGVDTLSRRMFGLIHAGVDDQVAAVNLLQMSVYSIAYLLLFRVVRNEITFEALSE